MKEENRPVVRSVRIKEINGKKVKVVSRKVFREIMELRNRNPFKVAVVTIAILLLACVGEAQVRIQAAFGVAAAEQGPKVNGILNVGYEVGKYSAMLDMRSVFSQKKAYYGIQGGYNIELDDAVYFRPYAGYWLRHTGSNSGQDRYVVGGVVKVLSTTPPEDLNGHELGGGVQYFNHAFFADAGYVGQWQVSAGVTFKF